MYKDVPIIMIIDLLKYRNIIIQRFNVSYKCRGPDPEREVATKVLIYSANGETFLFKADSHLGPPLFVIPL